MTTTNYRGYRIQVFLTHPSRNRPRWEAFISADGATAPPITGDTQTEAITKTKAWIDAQEGTE